jgi:hypothetical protein
MAPEAGGGGEEGEEQAAAERRGLLARLAVQPGLCAGCVHLRLLASPRSVFVRCGLADSDPAFPRYPALPVLRCAGFRPPPAAPAKDDAQP